VASRFVGRWDPAFLALGRGSRLGVPVLILWTAGVALAALFLLKHTRLGTAHDLHGRSRRSRAPVGIDVRGRRCSGSRSRVLRQGLVAVLLHGNAQFAPPNMATDYLLHAIAAVLLGMTMFEPGRCNVPVTLVGAATIGMLGNGLVLMARAYYVQDIMLGAIIVASGRGLGIDAAQSGVQRLSPQTSPSGGAFMQRHSSPPSLVALALLVAARGAGVQARRDRVPDVVGDARASRERRRRSAEGARLAGAECSTPRAACPSTPSRSRAMIQAKVDG
jgi:hypothetical protein